MFRLRLQADIAAIQRAQRRNLRLVAALRMGTMMGEAVRRAAIVTHRNAVIRTHVITGALRASHRIYIRRRGGMVKAIITPDPAAVRPGGGRPAVYGLYEHRRGGSHAFYRRAIVEGWGSISRAAGDGVKIMLRRTR